MKLELLEMMGVTPAQLLLGAVFAHPGPGGFSGTGEVVEIPDAHPLAVPRHLIDLHVRVIDRHVVKLGEGQVEQLAGRPEHARRAACRVADKV